MKLVLQFLILSILATAMSGCPSHSNCLLGQEIVIPTSDTSTPDVVMDIHLPDGKIETVYSVLGVPPEKLPMVSVPTGKGQLTIIAKAKGSLGIANVQIWVGGLNALAQNYDNGKAGEKGCTERLVSSNLTRQDNIWIQAVGINFGGVIAKTPIVALEVR
jgi:hypothetical protein